MRGLLFLSVVTLALLLPSATLSVNALAPEAVAFKANFSQAGTPWSHYWSNCVGADHALMALREDYHRQLTTASSHLGLKYVRFHGLLDDDMSAVLPGPNGTVVYSFYNIDLIFDFFLSIGMKPLVELSFMPELLASNHTTVFHYKGITAPPKSYVAWSNVISNLTHHLISRYGIHEVREWYFEVWNEPNLDFWSGTQEDYFKLYTYTARTLKEVDSQLRVGGPATAQSQWIPAFNEYCKSNSVPVDFVSTHTYPTDFEPLQRDIMKKVVLKAKQEASPHPIFYTEYNSGLFAPGFHDDPYASAFVMHNIQLLQGVLDVFSYWTFSDIFEEQGFLSAPFHQGFGMINIHGIPKPVYRAFELLHRTGSTRVALENNDHPTVGAFVTLEKVQQEGHSYKVVVIVYNHDIPDAPIKTETVSVSLVGIDALAAAKAIMRVPSGDAIMERIDDEHANAPASWRKMGSPEYLNEEQVVILKAKSEMRKDLVRYHYDPDQSTITFPSFDIPPQGVVALTLHL